MHFLQMKDLWKLKVFWCDVMYDACPNGPCGDVRCVLCVTFFDSF